jgi:hypothetical protein
MRNSVGDASRSTMSQSTRLPYNGIFTAKDVPFNLQINSDLKPVLAGKLHVCNRTSSILTFIVTSEGAFSLTFTDTMQFGSVGHNDGVVTWVAEGCLYSFIQKQVVLGATRCCTKGKTISQDHRVPDIDISIHVICKSKGREADHIHTKGTAS